MNLLAYCAALLTAHQIDSFPSASVQLVTDSLSANSVIQSPVSVTTQPDSAAVARFADSTAYEIVRRHAEQYTDTLTLRLCSELFASGLFAEALQILLEPGVDEIADTAALIAAAEPATTVAGGRGFRWSAILDGNYYDYTDRPGNTESWSADTALSYWQNTVDSGAGADAGIALWGDWRFGHRNSRVTGRLRISSKDARAEVAGYAGALNGYLDLTGAVRGTLRLYDRWGDSTDNANVLLLVNPNTRNAGRPLSLEIPIQAQAQTHRVSSPAAADFIQVETRPRLEYSDPGKPAYIRLGAKAHYVRYDSVGNENDMVRYGPHAAIGLFSRRLNGEIEAGYTWERNPRATSSMTPRSARVISARAQLALDPADWLRTDITVEYERYEGRYDVPSYSWDPLSGISTTTLSALLATPRLTLRPVFSLLPSRRITPGIRFNYEMEHTPFVNNSDGIGTTFEALYIDDWYDVYEPALLIRAAYRSIEVELEAAYRYTDIREVALNDDSLQWNLSSDSRAGIGVLDIRWRASKWITCELEARYEYGRYAPFTAGSGSIRNRSVYVTLSVSPPR